MASAPASSGWLKGKVKAVPSGDCLVIMGLSKAEIPPEKTITLSSLIAPRLARRGIVDEPFAWDSREFLRNLCIGKEVTFRVDYTVPSIGRDFGSVFLGDKNVAVRVVSEGWARVREQGQQKGEVSPFLSDLQHAEEQAKQQGVGRWSKAAGASEAAVRDLPPSAIGDASGFDANGLLAANKGKSMQAVVEQVRDGSTVRVYLLPEFQYVQVFVAGIQSPSMGRRVAVAVTLDPELITEDANGEASAKGTQSLTSAQRLSASTAASTTEISPDAFGREAKHFTEIRVLNRDVRIVLEGVDKFNNLIGSVYYPDGDTAKDLAVELIENGLAKYVEWSANMLEGSAKKKLKDAELQAKKNRLRMWTNFVPAATNSKAIHGQNFAGKVVEVVSGDCVIVVDDATSAERRVNLSSIRAPRLGRRDENLEGLKPEELRERVFAREAKDFLRSRVIGRQVNVSMEYSRKVGGVEGANPAGADDSRILDFGSLFLTSPTKADSAETLPSPSADHSAGVNVAELMVAYGLATVTRHRDFEERSNHYDALLAAETRAINGKKGLHSKKDRPPMHIKDLTMAPTKQAKEFLPFLARNRRLPAVVEHIFSGHRFKLVIPKETCSIAFSFSGVRCPGRGEPFSDEAIAFMRRRILQRNVEVEIETVDRTGTFLGSMWESKTNAAVPLVEAGLARLQSSFGSDKIADANLLARAEESAKRQKLKIWDKTEGLEVGNGTTTEGKQKEVLKVVVTEVLGGGKFYVQTVNDQRIATIQQQLASLSLQEPPMIGAFKPAKGDVVLAQFSLDNSWNRALIVNTPRGAVESPNDAFEVFYIDYGNQEVVPFSRLRPLDPSVSSAPGLAQLCSLAYIKVPDVDDDFGLEAAEYFSECTLNTSREFRALVEDKDTSGGKVKGQGTGTVLVVTLVDVEAESSINAAMLKEGLARLERRKRWDTKERQSALDNLEEFQTKAKKERLKMWQYGDVQSDDEDSGPPARKAGGRA